MTSFSIFVLGLVVLDIELLTLVIAVARRAFG